MIFDNRSYTRSPVSQPFIWVAEYYDDTAVTEFDWNTRKPNSFYDIDKNKLSKFGLIGEGSQIYYDVANGIFSINGHRIMISYEANGIEYGLTGRTVLYNDAITYKDAVSEANLLSNIDGGGFDQQIVQFNFGYKKQMELEDVKINFQAIYSLPMGNSYLQIRIATDKDLDGKLIIRRNGLIVDEIHAPLLQGQAGIVNWDIK